MRKQPAGQRPDDLAEWVVENYREYVEMAINRPAAFFQVRSTK